VFRYAVDYVNKNNIIGRGITLDYTVNLTGYMDTFENIQLGLLT
jgi:hypothetical protein